MKIFVGLFVLGCLLLASTNASASVAEPLDFDSALARALEVDQRIKEREHYVKAAQALRDEAQGSDDLIVSLNSFVGLTTQVDGGLYGEEGEGCTGSCVPRSDNTDIDGLTPWFNLQVGVIKPLYTFGKVESYEQAAKGNIALKQGDVAIQRGQTMLEVSKAYYGYLAARDTRKLLEDVDRRLRGAVELIETWLEEGSAEVKQSDLYALEAGLSLVEGYHAQAGSLERVAEAGLRMLVQWPENEPLILQDRRIRPLPMPDSDLAELQQQALQQRPEMAQVEAGLKARKALVSAKQAEGKPNIYAGIVAGIAYSPERDQLDNPHIYDPFNFEAATPVVGLQWDFSVGAQPARVAQAQAELDATLALAAFARQGIPFQVEESYHQLHGYSDMVASLEQSSRSARRWMIASYADFEAGVEQAEKIMTALQTYVLAHSQYLQTVYEYNMQVKKLAVASGEG